MKKYVIGADILRIISGFGVVLIHVTDPYISFPPFFGIGGFEWLVLNIANSAFRFSVPLFIMLSGYLLLDFSKDMDAKSFFRKRFWRIGIPFAFWLVFYFFWMNFMASLSLVDFIVSTVVSVDVGHLYFLFIITELYLITPFIFNFLKKSDEKTGRILFAVTLFFTLLIGALSSIYPKSLLITRNFLTIFIPYISYYLAGYFLKGLKLIYKNSFYSFLVYLTLVIFTAFASNGEINSYLRSYGSPNVMLMTYIIFIIGLNIDSGMRLLSNPIFIRVIKYMSSTIFGIYLVHTMVIDTLARFFGFSPDKFTSVNLMAIGFEVIIVFATSFIIVTIGKRIVYFRVIFG